MQIAVSPPFTQNLNIKFSQLIIYLLFTSIFNFILLMDSDTYGLDGITHMDTNGNSQADFMPGKFYPLDLSKQPQLHWYF